jgi:hypothetical protein
VVDEVIGPPRGIAQLGHKTPGHHSPPTTLKMRTELVLETSEHFSELTWLLTQEDFIEDQRFINVG